MGLGSDAAQPSSEHPSCVTSVRGVFFAGGRPRLLPVAGRCGRARTAGQIAQGGRSLVTRAAQASMRARDQVRPVSSSGVAFPRGEWTHVGARGDAIPSRMARRSNAGRMLRTACPSGAPWRPRCCGRSGSPLEVDQDQHEEARGNRCRHPANGTLNADDHILLRANSDCEGADCDRESPWRGRVPPHRTRTLPPNRCQRSVLQGTRRHLTFGPEDFLPDRRSGWAASYHCMNCQPR